LLSQTRRPRHAGTGSFSRRFLPHPACRFPWLWVLGDAEGAGAHMRVSVARRTARASPQNAPPASTDAFGRGCTSVALERHAHLTVTSAREREAHEAPPTGGGPGAHMVASMAPQRRGRWRSKQAGTDIRAIVKHAQAQERGRGGGDAQGERSTSHTQTWPCSRRSVRATCQCLRFRRRVGCRSRRQLGVRSRRRWANGHVACRWPPARVFQAGSPLT